MFLVNNIYSKHLTKKKNVHSIYILTYKFDKRSIHKKTNRVKRDLLSLPFAMLRTCKTETTHAVSLFIKPYSFNTQ